ncbi:unnamed protein product [Oppiella nova]|uniref:Uncharacterized protein n=1 Tax=Oppiella nova TaxID=334625 RepID=A0A7R9M8V8_9ACAR|nr:unnamed protein product [Oppiella nova]CAG2172654.1 unnamed protein product [Oppiella nova]
MWLLYFLLYSALTCESCRSFFRRTAPKAQDLKCYFGDKCEITCVTRKFCKKCRIQKCFDVGMKIEWILSGEERQLRKERKKRSKGEESSADSTSDSSSDTNAVKRATVEQSLVERRAAEMPALVRDLIFAFNDLEISRFRELFTSTVSMRDPVVTPTFETTNFVDALKVLQKRCDIKCRRIVKMSTNMSEFTGLCEEDKIALLKAACPEIICLISIINFNFDGEYWNVAIDEDHATTLRLDIFKLVQGNLYEAHRQFLWSMSEQYNSDINIIDLLIAIILFNPNQPNLVHKDMVKVQQQMYMYLLRRYLELKHSSKTESEIRFVKLMNNLQELYAVNRIHVDKFLESGPKEAGPLVEEIYDINN